jgi:excinuclease ABC subunit C
LLDGVAAAFGIDGPLNRVEVYDNSHIQGTNAAGAMIVAGPEGLQKNAYRKFTIRGAAGASQRPGATLTRLPPDYDPGVGTLSRNAGEGGPSPQGSVGEGSDMGDTARGGDDYAMMREVLLRRFGRALKEDPERERGTWPDLVLIDGGQGQLNTAQAVLEELGVTDVAVVGIAKGPDRNAGRERFFVPGRAPFSLEPRDPVLYFLQRLRDEAHRFAIGTHRAKRTKAIARSPLDEISGVGARRKQALLHHFGSARAVARAGLGELERVGGISKAVAKRIYDHFHPDG